MKLNLKFLLLDIFFIGVVFQTQLEYFINIKFISYIDELLIIFLWLFVLLKVMKYKRVNKFSIKISLAIFLFSAIGILSGYLNSNFILPQALLANFLSVKFLLLIIALIYCPLNRSIIEHLIKRMIQAAKIASGFAILNILFPTIYLKICPWGFIDRRNGIVSPCSIFEHPGTYGWYMLVIAFYYYAKYYLYRNKKDQKSFFIYIFFALLSMKAKVILSLISMLVVSNIILNKKKINIKALMISISSALIILILFKDYLIYTYKLYYTFDIQQTARAAFNINSLAILKEYFPLGVGFGKFGSYYAGVYYSEYYYYYGMNLIYGLQPDLLIFPTDTYWPSIIGETGGIGTVILIYCLYNIVKEIIKNFTLKKNEFLSLWAVLIFTQALVESLGAPTFNSAPQNIIIGIIVGMSLKNYGKKEEKNEENSFFYSSI